MITVAVENLLDSSQQALEFICDISQIKGIKVRRITPQNNIVYINHKKVPLKHYVDYLRKEACCDLLIIDLSKEAMKNQLYEHLTFNVAVLFESKGTQRLLKGLRSHFYILPEKYKDKAKQSITYGWSKDAHISASSAQRSINGKVEMQCCIGAPIATLAGTQILPKEFGICSSLKSVEGLLAAVATLILYGIDLEEYKKR